MSDGPYYVGSTDWGTRYRVMRGGIPVSDPLKSEASAQRWVDRLNEAYRDGYAKGRRDGSEAMMKDAEFA